MHIIKVCVGPSCMAKFGGESLKIAEKILEIKAGGTTTDGKFRLEKAGCMSNCDCGPNVMFCEVDSPLAMVMIDGKVEEKMQPNKFANKLKELKNI